MAGARSPQASTPPLKLIAASFGPMMYPTPRKAGLISGPRSSIDPLPTEKTVSHFRATTLNSVRIV